MTTCFRTLANSVYNVSDTDVPCGGSDPMGCCSYGDLCLSNGICRYTKPTAVESGFYLQSSTDPTFQGSTGQEMLHCTTLDYPDIVYNATTGLWACCSSDAATGVHCSTATGETWAAPAPEALATIASIQQALSSSTSTNAGISTTAAPIPPPSSSTPPLIAASSSTISVQSTTVSPTSSPAAASAPTSSPSPAFPIASPSTSSSPSSASASSNTAAAAQATSASTSLPKPSAFTHKASLSAGADAGIGVGVGLALIAILTLLFFAVRLARRRQRRQSSTGLFGGPDPTSQHRPSSRKTDVDGAAVADVRAEYAPPRPPRFTGEPQFPFPLPQAVAGGQASFKAGDQ